MRKYSPVAFTQVKLTGSFWAERLDTVLAHTIPSQYRQLQAHNMIEAMKVEQPAPPLTIPRNKSGFTTQIFWDSDVGKWIEAASYALAHKRDDEIEARIDEITDLLADAQLDDGYLNTWYIGREIENRWTNLRDNHELYNAGHLLEGAIAYFQATGRRKLLDVMERYMDHVADTFGPCPDQRPGYPGHQEIELALIRLFHLTGDRKRLDLATYFINQRGTQPHYFDHEAEARGSTAAQFGQGTYEYNQSHKPVREQDKVVGHAVRAMYMYAAMADLAAELDDEGLKTACETLWDDATGKRMYVTGGFGPSARNEGFTKDYDLPNDTAYAETCATVAMIFWAQRMLNLDLDGKYGDLLELGLFNGALSGLSQSGEHYFYENKLQSDGSHKRWAWHPCPCCTMNVSRLIASVGGYFHSTGDNQIAVHMYGGSDASFELAGGEVHLSETSDYPWSGDISIKVSVKKSQTFSLRLRIPAWAKGATASVNGESVDVAGGTGAGYLNIERDWQDGDEVKLDLPMWAERIYAHPEVGADTGKVALRRGPLVYAFEQMDNPDGSVSALRLDPASPIEMSTDAGLPNGFVALNAAGVAPNPTEWGDALYRDRPASLLPARLTAVPYFFWNNRKPGAMTVWMHESHTG